MCPDCYDYGSAVLFNAYAGDLWHDNDLVFASRNGTALYAGNVRRSFRAVLAAAGLSSADWTPRELRHSFVSQFRRGRTH